ncbi:uncharacterized protein LOC130990539 [Salvia miltiorrhiza]|uniref:uncharacterized protein LOC130990539 n=1 Tax=Salvia miltiorrhiza TaxID=226208 RepID=UPI0025AD6580|nr:uncharacterized protein LOC130990539 [Salvia miltiorrhiza]
MGGLSSIKTSNPLHIFSMKPPSSPISKLKTLFQTLIFSHMYRAARALVKAKSLLLEHVRDMQFLHLAEFKRNRNCKRKLYFGSFRLHYNWCASHVMPLAQESYYDASWNVVVPTGTTTKSVIPDGTTSYREPEGLSRYLEWLEEEKGNQESISNEIDKLADLFIADCHEKFRLEKQESYRRFQEMMARAV